MPRPLQRVNNVLGLSSNMNMIDLSPRPAAATQNCAAIVDLPVPAPPTISVLVPSSIPPPSSVVQLPELRGQFVAAAAAAMFGGNRAAETPAARP